jgi:hypothetical protein
MGDQFTWDGCYVSYDGDTIHAADGTPLLYLDRTTNNFHRYGDGAAVLYLDDITNTFHRHDDGCPVFYYDTFGEHLYPYKNVPPLQEE